MPIVGHSKGGGVMIQLTEARPHRVSRFANLDGMPGKWRHPDVADRERTKMLDSELSSWLDWRRARARRAQARHARRARGTAGRMNPRLSREWLRCIVTIGARKDIDGWRWKIDPSMRFGGFGPWRPDWSLERMRGLPVPLLAILAADGGDGLGDHARDPRCPTCRATRAWSRSRTPDTSCTSSTRAASTDLVHGVPS